MQNFSPTPLAYDPDARRTSKLGIASLVIAVGIFLTVIASILLLFLLVGNKGRFEGAIILVTLLSWVLAPGGHFIGLVLGVIDVCRSRSKKLVPSLGIAGNAILGAVGIAILIVFLNFLLKAAVAYH